MIDWGNLFLNGLWIFALSVALATFSYANWKASADKVSLKGQLASPGIQSGLNLAGMLFCLGLAGTSDTRTLQVVWVVLAILFGGSMIFSLREREKNKPTRNQ